jgi:coenzyme F420-dependent glucose-6-phosphate dehydrogenase
MPGRFFLGVGSGENLNEHVLGLRWPPPPVRQAMLEEAIHVIRLLWEGGTRSHRGPYYTVENARIYTLPETPPPIMVAASGPRAAELAGRIGDGLIATDPDRDLVKTFERAGGRKKPRHVEVSVCWARDEARARKTAREIWALAGLPGTLYTEIATPQQFEAALSLVTEDQVAEAVVCGPDPRAHRAAIREALEAGFDHVCIHQIGPDQEGCLRFYEREVLPHVAETRRRRPRAA